MSEPELRRRYDVTRRRRHAEERRRAVLDAARRQFVDQGVPATTISGIAAEAGVSPQTVYAVFGSKAGLLVALLDDLEARLDSPGYAKAIADAGTAAEQLALVVRFHCELFDQGLDLIELARRWSGDPAVGQFLDEGDRRRREACTGWVRSWRRSGALRRGLDVATATDLLWVHCGADLYSAFVVGCGWKPSRLEAWLVGTLRALLLDDG